MGLCVQSYKRNFTHTRVIINECFYAPRDSLISRNNYTQYNGAMATPTRYTANIMSAHPHLHFELTNALIRLYIQ